MKLSCPSCSAKYSIADEKVQDRLAKIRCRKCSATIIIDGKVSPPNVYTSDGQAGDGPSGAAPGEVGPGEYSVDFGDSDQRTMSVAQIVAAYNTGELTADTYVWTDGMGDWTPLGQVPEISSALHAAHAAPAAAAEPRAAAARTGAGRGSATDLFGSIATAGSEDDVTTSAPQPAQAPAAAAMATGARNESSVLFSLSALTAAAAAEPAVGGKTSTSSGNDAAGGDHDSGLIDLKALTSSAAADHAPAPLIATAPLGMAAPLGGMTAPSPAVDIDIPQQKGGNKTGLMILGGMLGMGIVIAGAIIATSGPSKDDAAAAAASAAAAMETTRQAAAPIEPEEKKDEVTAKPPATGTAVAAEPPKEEKKDEATTTTKVAPARTYRAPKPKPTAETAEPGKVAIESPKPAATSSTEEAPKKKKTKSCNCAPSDLMCAMQCAAGKK